VSEYTLVNLANDLREKTAKILRVLGDSNRLKIIELLRNGEMCQCDIIPLIGQSQPTVSRHLKLLEQHGVLESRKEGVKVLYKIRDSRIIDLLEITSTL
jgi:ArsR family transcriptional regulator